MIKTTIIILLLVTKLMANAQRIANLSIGYEISFLKYSNSTYGVPFVVSPEFGTIGVQKQNNFSLSQDIELFALFRIKKHSFRAGLGLAGDERTLTNNALAGPVGITRALVEDNYAVRLHVAWGHRLYGKRAIHIYGHFGIMTNLVFLQQDYNVINLGVKSLLTDNLTESLLGKAYKVVLNREYKYSRIIYNSGIDFFIYNSVFSLDLDYQSKTLDINFGNKPYFLNSLLQYRISYGLFFKNKFKGYEN